MYTLTVHWDIRQEIFVLLSYENHILVLILPTLKWRRALQMREEAIYYQRASSEDCWVSKRVNDEMRFL